MGRSVQEEEQEATEGHTEEIEGRRGKRGGWKRPPSSDEVTTTEQSKKEPTQNCKPRGKGGEQRRDREHRRNAVAARLQMREGFGRRILNSY